MEILTPYPFGLGPVQDFPQSPPYYFSNFGYWKDSTFSYPEATMNFCKNATKDFIKIPNKKRVLDIGAGLGGSSLFLAQDLGFSEIVYLNLPGAQSNFAEKNFSSNGKTQIQVQRSSWEFIQSLPSDSFSAVLVLDCFYHFQNQEKAVSEMYRILEPGGRLALTDISIPTISKNGLGFVGSFLSTIARIPSANWGDNKKNEAYLQRAGFEIEWEDWTEFIFEGFAKFCKTQSSVLGLFSERLSDASISGDLQYHFFSATKPMSIV